MEQTLATLRQELLRVKLARDAQANVEECSVAEGFERLAIRAPQERIISDLSAHEEAYTGTERLKTRDHAKASSKSDKLMKRATRHAQDLAQRPVIAGKLDRNERMCNLLLKLAEEFPTESDSILHATSHDDSGISSGGDPPSLLSTRLRKRPPRKSLKESPLLHIFVDNSNILIGFIDLIKEKHGFGKQINIKQPLMDFHALNTILHRGRSAERKIIVGSHPLTQTARTATSLGYKVKMLQQIEVQKSSDSKTRHREQGVDEVIQLNILESILDCQPATLVLATGDGSVTELSDGFFNCVKRALMHGWKIELVSWSQGLHHYWQDDEFWEEWGSRISIVILDDYWRELLV